MFGWTPGVFLSPNGRSSVLPRRRVGDREDPLTPTTSRAWGPLLAPTEDDAGCDPPSPPRGRGQRNTGLHLETPSRQTISIIPRGKSFLPESLEAARVSSGRQARIGWQSGLALGAGLLMSLALAGCGSGSSDSSSPGSNVTLSSITLAPAGPSINVGTVEKFTATGTYSDNSTQNLTSSATWASSTTAVATVQTGGTNPGLATAVTVGTAMITATVGTISGSTMLTVTNKAPAITSIAITPASPTVAAGSNIQLTATATRSDNSTQDVTNSASWTSSDTTKATVQTTGQSNPALATGVGAGTVTITATFSGISRTTSLTVTAPKASLTSIAVSPSTTSIVVGDTEQYTATGTYSDSSTQNLTRSVTWTSSNNTLATINTSTGATAGLATAVATGSVTISASYGGFSSLATLVITDTTQLFSATPLMDMPQASGPCLTYKSFPGGLFENCSDSVPADHDADGKKFASLVEPLDINGNPSPTGRVVLLSIGMGAAANEFSGFIVQARGALTVNQTTLSLLNGAETDMDACFWIPAFGPPTCDASIPNNYDRIDTMLTNQGLSPLQVQAVWIKNANGRTHSQATGCPPHGTLCVPLCDETIEGCSNTANTTDALNFEQELGETVRAAYQRFPNLKLAFITSRIFAGYSAPGGGNPEPFAYEYGFSVQWLIEAQIKQIRSGEANTIDPVAGDLNYNNGSAPWINWGPYFWADGPTPRSDGLAWCGGSLSPNPPCNGANDFAPNGEDPVVVTKQDNMLMNFFLNSPYTTWFQSPQAQKQARDLR